MLMAFVTSLEGQVQTSLTVFVTSSFQSHSLVSTIGVVQGVINGSSPAPLLLPRNYWVASHSIIRLRSPSPYRGLTHA
jgi:hypothetical protein